MGAEIRILSGVLARLLEEARRVPEWECCGLLAGRDDVVTETFPATNALASATAYEIAPEELFRIFRQMRAAGLEHMGIYHSHPHGLLWPSVVDIERAWYSEVAYFILSPRPDAAEPVRAFHIRDGEVFPLRIVPS